MADTILAVPALRGLRESFPDSSITVSCRAEWASILEQCPYVDVVMPSADKVRATKPRQVGVLSSSVRGLGERGRFDTSVVLHRSTRAAQLYARLTGAQRRVGVQLGLRGALTDAVPWQGTPRATNLAMLQELGAKDRRDDLELWCSDEAQMSIRKAIGEHGFAERGPLIVLHPGSDWSCQQSPPKLWADVADSVRERLDARVVITGGALDQRFADDVLRYCRPGILNLAGKTTLDELFATVAQADVVTAVDSGPAAAAVALGRPLVVLVGENEPVWWSDPPGPAAVQIVQNGTAEQGEAVRRCWEGKCGRVSRCDSPWCMSRGRMGLIRSDQVIGAVCEVLEGARADQRVLGGIA